MAYSKYTDQERYEILNDTENFIKKHPELSRNQVLTLRRYYRKTGLKMEQELGPNQEPTGRLYKTWEVSAFNPKTEEWTTAVNHGYEYSPDPDVDNLFPQIEAAKITPTRRKQIQRASRFILGYGDGQVGFRRIINPLTEETEMVPLHNVEMHRVILQVNADLMPETAVNGGDFADFPEISRFPKDSDHFHKTLTPSLRWIHDFYAQMRSDNPQAHLVEVSSNHAERVGKKILKDAPEFYDFYRPGETYPAWTYYSMANLQPLDIDYISGYPGGEFVYGTEYDAPPIVYKHGDLSGKNAISQEADRNPTVNIIRWHNHGERSLKRTTREGRQLFYLVLGSSCMNGGPVPGYRSAVNDQNRPVAYHNPDHVNSFIVTEDFKDGTYTNTTVDVVNGVAKFMGKVYDGNVPYEWEKRYGYVGSDDDNKK